MACGAISESLTAEGPVPRADDRAPGRARFRGPCFLGRDEAENQAKAKGIISQSETKRFAERS
jgi:hypothetical protein